MIECSMCSGANNQHSHSCPLRRPMVAQSYDFRGVPARATGLFASPVQLQPVRLAEPVPVHAVTGVPMAPCCAGCGGQGKCTCHDPVGKPSHYTRLDPQPIDVIAAWGLNFNLGNVVKYIARAGYKDKGEYGMVTDLRKAADYLAREIARHEKVSTK